VSGHYQWNRRVLCPKQSVSTAAWAAYVEKNANAPSILTIVIVVAHDEGSVNILDGPRRRDAAVCVTLSNVIEVTRP
jgi:hypothetical protein